MSAFIRGIRTQVGYDLNASVTQDPIEQGWIFPVAVANQLADGGASALQVHDEVPRGLRDPPPGGCAAVPRIRTRRLVLDGARMYWRWPVRVTVSMGFSAGAEPVEQDDRGADVAARGRGLARVVSAPASRPRSRRTTCQTA
jgi:hypothetical protein